MAYCFISTPVFLEKLENFEKLRKYAALPMKCDALVCLNSHTERLYLRYHKEIAPFVDYYLFINLITMDPNSIVGRIYLGEDNQVSLNDRIESHGEWDSPECHDTANSGQKKEAKAFTFYKMETEEVSER
ncbi:hypothetical protein Tco_0761834 [Tanacetum coccineum]